MGQAITAAQLIHSAVNSHSTTHFPLSGSTAVFWVGYSSTQPRNWYAFETAYRRSPRRDNPGTADRWCSCSYPAD